jgi:alkanesulfonate monooxygenase SsuD/methylene tetrahydromethanopterin reductase-like flavin-dependent oxidoreductase (luciferase family)
LAARNAEVIFPVQSTLEKARVFCAEFKAQVAAVGRSPHAVSVLPGIVPIIAETDAAVRGQGADGFSSCCPKCQAAPNNS